MYIPRIYCGLDGVLADFNAGVSYLFKKRPHSNSNDQLWSKLACTPDFYTYLPWKQDGHKLWTAIRPLQPTILTGIPGRWAEAQKIDWINRELGPNVSFITCPSKHKFYHCPTDRPGAILIDDNKRYKEQWQEAGGIFILHTETEETIKQLELLLGIPLESTSETTRC